MRRIGQKNHTELEAGYPVVVTNKLAECRHFYTSWLGFEVVFEATSFVYLKPSVESPYGIAFMSPDHPSRLRVSSGQAHRSCFGTT